MTLPLNQRPERGEWTSASNAEYDLRCPARHLRQRGQPEETSAERESQAKAGRAVHAALAAQGTPEHEKLWKELNPAERDVHDRCADIEARKFAEFFGADTKPGLKVHREVRFWVKIQNGNAMLEHSGQPDVVYRLGMRALLLEYKTLFGDIEESPSNMQCRDGACLIRGNLMLSEVGTVLIQPWVSMDPKICLYRKEDLDRAEREMFERVIASNTPGAEAIAGELQCKFCRAKKDCVEYQKFSSGMLPMLAPLMSQPMTRWTPEQFALAAENLGPAQALIDQIKLLLKEKMTDHPGCIPGWQLSEGKKREVINDPEQAFQRFAKLGEHVPDKDRHDMFMRCVAVSKVKLKEGVAALTGLKGKELAKVMDTLCEGIVTITTIAGSIERATPANPLKQAMGKAMVESVVKGP